MGSCSAPVHMNDDAPATICHMSTANMPAMALQMRADRLRADPARMA